MRGHHETNLPLGLLGAKQDALLSWNGGAVTVH
jgi:hypothetical protein